MLAHLKDYLLGYWTTPALWSSWSDFGRKVAPGRLNCTFEGVLLTTNHLESFNGLLKHKYLRGWQNGGRQLRLDVLLMLLVTRVLPSIFHQQQHMEKQDQKHWDDIITMLPGGQALLDQCTSSKTVTFVPLFYLTQDADRDTGAKDLI